MTKDMEITIKIPADLVEQIESLFNSVALQVKGWVPKDRSYETFLLQAIETEIWGLQDYEADLTRNSRRKAARPPVCSLKSPMSYPASRSRSSWALSQDRI